MEFVNKNDFNRLENRVTVIESLLNTLIKTTTASLPDSSPIVIIVEQELFIDNIQWSDLSPHINSNIYSHIEKSPGHIFVRIYLHNVEKIEPKINSKSGHGYHEYYYEKPYYNVLIVKNKASASFYTSPKMNTVKTANILNYSDPEKRVGLYFGYSNDNIAVTEDSMFNDGKSNGVFFVMNDKTNNQVKTYLGNRSSDFEKVNDNLADGNVYIYKSKQLGEVVKVSIIAKTPPPQTSKPTARSSEDDWGDGPIHS